MDNVVLVAGLACLIAAVAGGGLRAFGVEVPVLQSRARQVILGVIGVILIFVARFPQRSPISPGNSPEKPTANGTIPAEKPEHGSTGVQDLKAGVTVSGHWIHQQIPQTFFNLKQEGDAVTSEGNLGHAEGRFTGPNTFTLTWQTIGTFEGTVKGDMISWSGGTSWKRTISQADVSGRWAHQQIAQTFFTLKQDGDGVISEGSFGHAEGRFTGPNTFTLTWQTIGTFEGTVKDDTISWSGGTSWKRQ